MPYTIGEVARMMNIAPSTLRYYEKEGLLSLGVRASNGQRTYTDDDIATLSIIEYLKFCGFQCVQHQLPYTCIVFHVIDPFSHDCSFIFLFIVLTSHSLPDCRHGQRYAPDC